MKIINQYFWNCIILQHLDETDVNLLHFSKKFPNNADRFIINVEKMVTSFSLLRWMFVYGYRSLTPEPVRLIIKGDSIVCLKIYYKYIDFKIRHLGALETAIQFNSIECFKWLFDNYGINMDYYDKYAIMRSCLTDGRIEMLNHFMVGKFFNNAKLQYNLVEYAIHVNRPDTLRWLISKGMKCTLIHSKIAVENDCLECLQICYENCGKVSAQCRPLAHRFSENPKILEFLDKIGA